MAYRWRMDGSPRWKKTSPLENRQSKTIKSTILTQNFFHKPFFQSFFHRFCPSPKRSRGTAGNSGESSMSSFVWRQVTSKEAKVERRRARDDPLWKAPQPSQSEAMTRAPKKVRKKMGKLTLCNKHTHNKKDSIDCMSCYLNFLLNLDEFGIIWGYLGTPSHQMPLFKFFTSSRCKKGQEWQQIQTPCGELSGNN